MGSVNPDFMPHGEEYALITKDTMESLMKDYDVNRYVTIESMREHGRTYIVTIKASPSLLIKLMITCNNDCEYYVDNGGVSIARSNADTYFRLILKASTIMSRVFETDMPRILLTHNPTIYGKIILINRNEAIALSIWDLLRLNDVLSKGDLTLNDISNVVDTFVHEFLHYILDRKYLVSSTFIKMMKRIPSVIDDGVIHELIAWTLTSHVSRYVAECIKYGRASKLGGTELAIQYPPIRRRHALTARKIINELLMRFNGDCS
ncbi:hypothetical protein [Vulcanisaeta distributa]|uniref:hypothetical protein n=1 Tax=Vulcanisaeta distributa TaxID=164451 RepID=UPI001FB48EE3|nr:hypothetical protein [Vulcanisaeta distributa]